MFVRRLFPALAGLRLALTLPEVLPHVLVGLLVVTVGLVVCLDRVSWALLAGAIGLVLVAEVVNSALEHALDALHARRSAAIRSAKDLAAAAVLLASVAASVIGLVVFLPPFLAWGRVGHCLASPLSGRIGE